MNEPPLSPQGRAVVIAGQLAGRVEVATDHWAQSDFRVWRITVDRTAPDWSEHPSGITTATCYDEAEVCAALTAPRDVWWALVTARNTQLDATKARGPYFVRRPQDPCSEAPCTQQQQQQQQQQANTEPQG